MLDNTEAKMAFQQGKRLHKLAPRLRGLHFHSQPTMVESLLSTYSADRTILALENPPADSESRSFW
jgi:hypothetical protein